SPRDRSERDRSPRDREGGGGGEASASTGSLVCCPTAVSAPASASSRYGLSVVSAPAGLLGRFPRPRRGGRRRSFMPLSGKRCICLDRPRCSRGPALRELWRDWA